MPKEPGLFATRGGRRAFSVGPLHGGTLPQLIRCPGRALDAGGHCALRRNPVLAEHQNLRPGVAGAAVVERRERFPFGTLKPVVIGSTFRYDPTWTTELVVIHPHKHQQRSK